MRVIVTGLPRCGTSFLTGLIAKIGFSIGNGNAIRKKEMSTISMVTSNICLS